MGFGPRQVCFSTVLVQFLQTTSQHQWNLHSHLSTRCMTSVVKPRPQHMISQPSVSRDVLLQSRPAVPREPENNVTQYNS